MKPSVEIEAVPGHKLGDVELINRIMKKLVDNYPGYRWRVGIHDEPTGGVVYIMNMDLNAELWSGAPYGYILKLASVYSDESLHCVMIAAGEILERARLERGKARDDQKIGLVDGVKPQHQPRSFDPYTVVKIGRN